MVELMSQKVKNLNWGEINFFIFACGENIRMFVESFENSIKMYDFHHCILYIFLRGPFGG